MSPFLYGRDYDTDLVAQQLLSSVAWLIVALTGIVIAVHLLRRSPGQPLSTDPSAKVAPESRVVKYALGARLYHWGNTLFVLALAVSGIALFAPGSLGDGPWLLLHEVMAVAFVLALVLHIVVAPRRGNGRAMWFDRSDIRDVRLMAANFFGRTRHYPAFGKYDPLQKLYHALLTVFAAALIVSGIYLFWSAEAWATFSHEWMRRMRLVHDIGAFIWIALVIGHMYFGIIRVNWPQLLAMITGRLRGSSFNRYHDANRWKPDGSRL